MAVQFQSSVPAMRILENEHRYLSFLMSEWHPIALYILNHEYGRDEAARQFQKLQELLIAFRALFVQHSKKEETFFFPLLGRYIGFEQGPLVSIEAEHEEILAYIDHFLHHAEGEGERTMGQMSAIARDASEAFEILTIHFVKEESVLFPMVAQVMLKKDQESLFEQMNTLLG
jgi:regulator of cell morphogenesis and NO signaling